MITGKAGGEDHVFIEIYNDYSIIDHNFIYGVFPNSREKILIDRFKDPLEYRNVISDPSYAKVADSLQQILFNFHPQIEKEYAAGMKLADFPDEKVFRQDSIYNTGIPYLGGKPFNLEVKFTYTQTAKGPLVVFHDGNTHGLSVFIKDKSIFCGLRTWSEDQIEEISNELKKGENSLTLRLSPEGMVEAILNGKLAQRFQSSWPIPVQGGNKHFLTGSWTIGKPAGNWYRKIGNYNNEKYTSDISGVKLSIR